MPCVSRIVSPSSPAAAAASGGPSRCASRARARAWRSAAGDGRNCVCPAYIETDLNRDHLSRLRRTGEVQELERAHPLGLGGSPDDVATAALYLASDDARWNTGCCLPVDGGVSATI